MGKHSRDIAAWQVNSMVADRTSMTRELDKLIDQQIHTLKQEAKISEPELNDYRQRSQRIRMLCRTLDQGSRQPVAAKSA
jgi:SMC interacting uncharacterized protein involved in chromosome segregation